MKIHNRIIVLLLGLAHCFPLGEAAHIFLKAIPSYNHTTVDQKLPRTAAKPDIVRLNGAGLNATKNSLELFGQKLIESLGSFRMSRVMVLSGEKTDYPQTVWISGVGRTGTTLLEELVIAAGAGQGMSIFALFEPCHENDELYGKPLWKSEAYEDCMRRVLACNFDGLKMFHFNASRDITSGLGIIQDNELMNQLCVESALRIYKTIPAQLTTTPEIDSIASDSGAQVKVIRISRDPRATYASQIENFRKQHFQYPDELCQLLVDWDHEGSPHSVNFLPVKFEDLVTDHPMEVSRLLSFLSWKASTELNDFLAYSMANSYCASETYGTCRTPEETEETLTKWQSQLDLGTLHQFESETCARAVSIFGYHV